MEPNRCGIKTDDRKKCAPYETAEDPMLTGAFVSDCEGPISKNDNAYELTAYFVPNGGKLFSIISEYDDILADILKRPMYNAGDTLKLILPFLKANDVTDRKIREFSSQNLLLIAGTKDTLKYISSFAEAFIVSTSYEHYIRELCELVGFPFENAYCTRLSIDKYTLKEAEKAELKAIAQEITEMQKITIPNKAKTLQDFSSKDQASIKRLDEIFWRQIPAMGLSKIFSEITTIGGEQKAQAIRKITKKLQISLSRVMYVGDSITDVQAFQLVRANGGFAVAFNGNDYAVKNAEVSIMSDNNIVTAFLADVFLKLGKTQVLDTVKSWDHEHLKNNQVNLNLMTHFLACYPKGLPKVQIVTQSNMKSLSKESSKFRKKVRGEAVGKLG